MEIPRHKQTPDEIKARRNALESDLLEILESYGITPDNVDAWNDLMETISEYGIAVYEYELAMKAGLGYELAKLYLKED